MSESLGFENVFDDVLVESRIVINESLVELIKGPVRLGDILSKYSGEKFYRIAGGWDEPGQGRFEFKIYKLGDKILGVILEGPRGKVYGADALKIIGDRMLEMINVYEAPLDLLREIIGEDRFRRLTGGSRSGEARGAVEEGPAEVVGKTKPKETQPPPPPPPPVVEAPVSEAAGAPAQPSSAQPSSIPASTGIEDLRRSIARLIGDFGLEYLNIEVSETDEIVKVFIDLSPITTWISLRSILYSVVYKYVELRRRYPVMKLEVRLGDLHDSLLLTKPEEVMVAAIVGRIEYIFIQNGVPVTDTRYELDKENMRLTVFIKAKKPIYPGVKAADVARSAYNEARNEWRGELRLRVKTGRFSEIKIPK